MRLPQLLAWLAANPVDALVLQETKLSDDKFPVAEIEAAGYSVVFHGQKTYNGVALLSRGGAAAEVVRNIPGYADEQARVNAGTAGGVRVIGGYFPNGQAPDSTKFAYKMAWLDALHEFVQAELVTYPKLMLMGDFNIAPEDRDAWDRVGLAGTIHLTAEARAQFQRLLGLGLVDAFRLFEQAPKSYSWWDYRMLAFRKNQRLRIDHVLVSESLRSAVRSCHIDRAPRKNERPSDHAPVVVEIDG